MQYKLGDLVSLTTLRGLMASLHEMTGIGQTVLDASGDVLVTVGDVESCQLACGKKSMGDCGRYELDNYTSIVNKNENIKYFTCPLNRRIYAAPITIYSDQIGVVLLGPVPDINIVNSDALENDAGNSPGVGMLSLENVVNNELDYVSKLLNFFHELSSMLAASAYQQMSVIETTASLLASEAKFTQAFNLNPVPMAISELESGKFVDINQSLLDMMGYKKEEIVGKTSEELGIFESTGDRQRMTTVLLKGKPVKNVEMTVSTKSGRKKTVLFSAELTKVHDRNCIVSMAVDVTERTESMRALSESEANLKSILETSTQAYILLDRDGKVKTYNKKADKLALEFFGHSLDAKRDVALQLPEQIRENFTERLKNSLAGSDSTGHVGVANRNGEERLLEFSFYPVTDYQDNIFGTSVAIKDITEQKKHEERLDHLAHHDPLTGLPNRLLFRDRLAMKIAESRRRHHRLAIMFIDLDGFKLINDQYGHDAGDLVLKEISRRLCEVVRDEDSVARMGGDEFTFMVSDITSESDAEKIASRIIGCFGLPVEVNSNSFQLSASIGISFFPDDAIDLDGLLNTADMAMYKAKEIGPGNYSFANAQLNAATGQRSTKVGELQKALENGELRLYYQPVVDISTGYVLCVEALIRWQHPGRGMLGPEEIIPLAEDTGLIVPVTRWVIETACAKCRDWYEKEMFDAPVAVNMTRHFLRDRENIDWLKNTLLSTGLPAERLVFEFKERVLTEEYPVVAENLRLLHDMGVRVSVDDFCMSYEALDKLGNLSVDTVKIDRACVRHISQDAQYAKMADAIVSIAHKLNINVVAGGVETDDQVDVLSRISCDEMQGYIVSHPVQEDDLGKILADPQ